MPLAIQNHINELLAIVAKANAAIMPIYTSNTAVVQTKADNSPLTQADIASHHIITDSLAALFPHIPIISEEGSEEENRQTVQKPQFWLIDPIDGTKEFINRTNEFTVCIALVEDNMPRFGIISAPALGVTYYGGPGLGSFKIVDGNAPQPMHVANKSVGVVLGSRSALNQQTSDYIATNYPGSTVTQVGSQLKLPYIAEGLADAYPRVGQSLHLWDLAPGQAILEGAGGRVRSLDGSPINYHSDSFLVGEFLCDSLGGKLGGK